MAASSCEERTQTAAVEYRERYVYAVMTVFAAGLTASLPSLAYESWMLVQVCLGVAYSMFRVFFILRAKICSAERPCLRFSGRT